MKKIFVFSILAVSVVASMAVIRGTNAAGSQPAETKPFKEEKTPYNNETKTIIENYKFTAIDEKDHEALIFYIISVKKDVLDFKEYRVKPGESIDVRMAKGESFIVSLLANEIINADWKLQNDNKYTALKDKYFFTPVNTQIDSHDTYGWNERRENFSFEAAEKGKTTLLFDYVNNSFKDIHSPFTISIVIY